MSASICTMLALLSALATPPAVEYERALAQQIPAGVMIEAHWENHVNFHQFLRFDLESGAFVSLTPLYCNLRDPQGRSFVSKPPFETFEEIVDPIFLPHFDGVLDSLTSFFLLRSFSTPSKTVEPMTLAEGGFRVKTTYVNDARDIPYEVYERANANRLTPMEWFIPADFSRIEMTSLKTGKVSTRVPSEKSPRGAWLLEDERNTLRSARTLPSNPKAFTPDAAREDYTRLSRMSERRLVFSRTKTGDPTVANPPTPAELEASQARNTTPAWRWPLLGAGVLVFVAAWIARRRSA